MIRTLHRADRRRVRMLARRQWRTLFVPFAILNVEGHGRALVAMRFLDTRWSETHRRRMWRVPVSELTVQGAN